MSLATYELVCHLVCCGLGRGLGRCESGFISRGVHFQLQYEAFCFGGALALAMQISGRRYG